MESDVASSTEADCRCPQNKYDIEDSDGYRSPVWCWKEGIESGRFDLLDENKPSLTDVISGGRCVTCPDCLVCDYEKYRGLPFVAAEWYIDDRGGTPDDPMSAVVQYGTVLRRSFGDIDIPEEKLVTPRVRDVFGCPYEGSCKPELEYRDTGNFTLTSESECDVGFKRDTLLCGQCADGYSLSKGECSKCENMSTTSAVGFLGFAVAMVLLRILYVRRKRKKEAAAALDIKHIGLVATYVTILARVVPSLVGDVKVFISVYQMLTNLGLTLSIKFPPVVEMFIGIIKELINIDVFSLAALSCFTGSNYYTKLWLSLLTPLLIEATIWVVYKQQLSKKHLEDLPDVETAERQNLVRSHLSEVHHKKRKAKSAGRKEWAHGPLGLFRLYRRHDAHAAKEAEAAEDAHERAFEHDRLMKTLYRKQSQKAELEQTAFGWGFFVIFM